MTILNITGFELGHNKEFGRNGSGTMSYATAIKRTGDYSLRVNPTTTGTGYQMVGGYSLSDGIFTSINAAAGTTVINCYYRFYFYVATLPASNSEQIAEIAGVNFATKLPIRITSNGYLQVYQTDGTTQIGVNGTTQLSTGVWYRIEMMCGSDADTPPFTANFEIRINGVTEFIGTIDNNQNYHGFLYLGKRYNRNGQSVDFYYDDVEVNTATWPGIGSVIRLDPDGDGTYTDFVRNTGANDWECVNEVPPSTTKYLYSNTVIGQSSTVTCETLANAGITDPMTIKFAMAAIECSCNVVNQCNVKFRLRSGTTNSDTSVAAYVNTYFLNNDEMRAKLAPVDPATGAAWTTAGINAAEVGIIDADADIASRWIDGYLMVELGEEISTPPTSMVSLESRRHNSYRQRGTGTSSHEFYLTDDAGFRIGLLSKFAYASYSRSTRGYGVIQFGIPLEEWMTIAPYVFQPDWRLDVWRSPAYGYPKRRESSYLLRKYRIYDQQDGVRMMELFGRSPIDILRRWCVVSAVEADYKKTGAIDDLMKAYATQEFITNAHTVPVGEFTVEGNLSLGPSVTASYCGKNVLAICKDLKDTSFSLNNNLSTNRRIFFDVVEDSSLTNGFGYMLRTYADLRGTDRTDNLIFSIENGNLKTPEYYEDYLDQITVAQVNTKVVTGPDTTLSRWNSILDYRNSFTHDDDADTVTANKMLKDGMDKKSFGAYFINTPGSSDQPRSLYGIDWDLGDLLRVQYAKRNMDAEVEIVWISVDENGQENIVGSNRVGE